MNKKIKNDAEKNNRMFESIKLDDFDITSDEFDRIEIEAFTQTHVIKSKNKLEENDNNKENKIKKDDYFYISPKHKAKLCLDQTEFFIGANIATSTQKVQSNDFIESNHLHCSNSNFEKLNSKAGELNSNFQKKVLYLKPRIPPHKKLLINGEYPHLTKNSIIIKKLLENNSKFFDQTSNIDLIIEYCLDYLYSFDIFVTSDQKESINELVDLFLSIIIPLINNQKVHINYRLLMAINLLLKGEFFLLFNTSIKHFEIFINNLNHPDFINDYVVNELLIFFIKTKFGFKQSSLTVDTNSKNINGGIFNSIFNYIKLNESLNANEWLVSKASYILISILDNDKLSSSLNIAAPGGEIHSYSCKYKLLNLLIEHCEMFINRTKLISTSSNEIFTLSDDYFSAYTIFQILKNLLVNFKLVSSISAPLFMTNELQIISLSNLVFTLLSSTSILTTSDKKILLKLAEIIKFHGDSNCDQFELISFE